MTYQFHLEEAYANLTFKFEGTAHDKKRLEAFVLLLQMHLVAKDILDLQEFEKLSNRDACIAEFIELYGKQLWPGSVAARQHLAQPALKKNTGNKGARTNRQDRSFLASFDGIWTSRNSGWRKDKPRPITKDESIAMSKIGKALRNFIEAVLEVPINKNRFYGLPSTEELCVKATKVVVDGAGEEEDGRPSPTMSEIERDLGIGDGVPPGEEMTWGATGDDGDETSEPTD